MDKQMFGLKEIYNCIIKATYDIEMNGKTIKAGEPIFILDSIQMANFQELKDRIDARGGYNNQSRVSWESTKEVAINFTQGTFSKVHLAFLGNSHLHTEDTIVAPKEEVGLEIDENLSVELQYDPVGEIYVYHRESGDLLSYKKDGKKLTFEDVEPYTELDIYYDFMAEQASVIAIGRQLIGGYLTLTAKTRLKDDETGKTVTGIFKIPRLKLMSDFSIRLGNTTPPSIGNFRVSAMPTGSKGSETVMDLIVLRDDIDSDM